ncbi:MAG: hypothetical protein AAGF74_03120 [Pseudomonadota bacterium]
MQKDRDVVLDFDVNEGGPFVALMEQLNIWRQDRDTRIQRAAILVALAWGVPLILSVFEEHAIGPVEAEPYLLSLNAWARYFLAVGLFVLTEKKVADMLRSILGRFFDAPIVAESSRDEAVRAVTRALERRNSRGAEGVILVIAALATLFTSQIVLRGSVEPSWILQPDSEGVLRFTVAGIWGIFISGTIFFFLLFRWLWRFIIWSRLLSDFSNLDLRLAVQHPDKSGGLGFIGLTPIAFAPLVFVVSLWIAPVTAQLLARGELTTTAFTVVMAAWLGFVHIALALPLLTFTEPLEELKKRTMRITGAQATRGLYEREELQRSGEAPLPSGPAPAFPPSGNYAAADAMSTVLFNRASIVPVSLAALIPLALAGATQFPFREVLQILKKLVLF